MCELFIDSDVDKWISRTKSLRIDGVATSIRMENFFWAVLPFEPGISFVFEIRECHLLVGFQYTSL